MPNGCLQHIAANRFSIPQDVIAILLQGFVRHALVLSGSTHEGRSRAPDDEASHFSYSR